MSIIPGVQRVCTSGEAGADFGNRQRRCTRHDDEAGDRFALTGQPDASDIRATSKRIAFIGSTAVPISLQADASKVDPKHRSGTRSSVDVIARGKSRSG
jgi:hypothetical protein